MATFEELMEQFRNPGAEGIPENFAEELQKTYTDDLSVRDAAVEARKAEIVERDELLAAREAEVTRLKAVNYDLLVAAPKAGNPADNSKPDDGAAQGGIDSLFE